MATTAAPAAAPDRRLAVAGLLAGALVAVALGVYGNVHDPTGRSLVTLFFTATINLKVWLATLAGTLALFQLWLALRMYGRIGPGKAADWVAPVHRLAGLSAFLISIPVAYHCLWALGFQSGNGSRVLAHSLFGCLFYGALVTKVFFVRSRRIPNWALPLAGGALFTTLIAIWFTSSFWYFTSVEFPGF